jgi:hypothetical protein
MTSTTSLIKIAAGVIMAALILVAAVPYINAAAPQYDVNGTWDITLDYNGVPYTHDITLVQAANGNLTGSGGYPAGLPHTYEWTLTSGSVSGNVITFTANYTASADAVTPQTTMVVIGTIASNGLISGTWSDNYSAGVRAGSWTTATGTATALGALAAEDFGVMNESGVKGYTSGFGLTDATFASSTSVVMKLYSSSTLLQTNTGTALIGTTILGNQISSPFDVFGTFDYVTDGYWTNVRGSEYGQTLIPTKVVATVTLENGKVVTAENMLLSGDPTTIFPVVVPPTAPVLTDVPATVTIPELSLYTFDANATDVNGDTLTFNLVEAPAGAMIAGATGLFTWTPTEAQGVGVYTFTVRVSDGSLIDTQLITINVTEVPDAPVITPTDKNQCKNGGWKTFTAPSFKNQGQCVSSINRN